MAVELTATIDTAQADALFKQIDRNRAVLGKGMRESVQWGGSLLARSLAARTSVSEKRREVVDMPIQRLTRAGEADRRYARFGVKKWIAGVQVIKPINRGGRGVPPYATISEARKDRRTIIGRRGLAKKSWAIMANRMVTGGTDSIMGVRDASSVNWSGGYVNPSVRMTNRLRYMEKALQGGFSAVQSAMNAAANKMEHEISRKAAEAYGAS
jgi:hypothetical protein